jgi:tetratricopeptide (TPR) repeat protein
MSLPHHEPSCLCYKCLQSEVNPYLGLQKLDHVVKKFLTWESQRQENWLESLHSHILENLNENAPFSHFIQAIFERGFTRVLLTIIAQSYELPPHEEPLPQEKSSNISFRANIAAAMILSDLCDKLMADKDILEVNGVQILCRSILYGLCMMKTTCMIVLAQVIRISKYSMTSYIEDPYIRSLIVRTLVYAFNLPRTTFKDELKTVKGAVQMAHFAKNHSNQRKELHAIYFMEVLYLHAAMTIRLLLVRSEQNRSIFIYEPQLLDTLLTQISTLPHESYPDSRRLADCGLALALLTKIPAQLEDISNDFEQMLVDAFYSADDINERLVQALRQFSNLNLPEYMRNLVKAGENYAIEPITSQQAQCKMEMLQENIFQTTASILEVYESFSFAIELRDKLQERYILNTALYHLSLVLPEHSNPSERANLSMLLGGSVEDVPIVSQLASAKISANVVGSCVIILRNLGKSINQLIYRDARYVGAMIVSATGLKDKGVLLLKQNRSDFKGALYFFSSCLHVLPRAGDVDAEIISTPQVKELKVTALSNRAEMFIQLSDYRAAKIDLDIALQLDPQHEKSKRRMERVLKVLK